MQIFAHMIDFHIFASNNRRFINIITKQSNRKPQYKVAAILVS